MGRILDVINSQEAQESKKDAMRQLVRESMERERNVLSRQIISLMCPGLDVSDIWYDNLDPEYKYFVDRLGFFKYGHLMSDEDVGALGEDDLREDYKCIKIEEENIMNDNNLDQISAIWGTIAPNNELTLRTIANQQAKIANQQAEIAQLVDVLTQLGGGDLVQKILQNRSLSQSDEVASQSSETGRNDPKVMNVVNTITSYIDKSKADGVTPQSIKCQCI
ncbi:MAG: hypothetical protein LBF25_02515 [Puniceicoccales bacterium]|jgi:cell division protein FtsB|nr:hypothetical protein [Puniceicoccales bacterium]